ncbi:YopX family protein [Enterococcus faecium]|nr:YopX family protein [Enterococcus faecium]MDQ8251888.1 YopX family protein [Enterococcus faecium]MDQ8304019.1 YopX family protein [Enterococcus faecium]MDQ8428075.1 YopX family protein [Enterococcus faecium]
MIPRYRAWDKKTKTIQEIESISFKEKKLVIDQKSVAWFNSDYIRNFDEVELMQSTGLRDKNGVEMFEGDIVKTLEVDSGVTFSTIKFEEGAFCIDYKNLGTEFEFLYFADSHLEVVGNIWENSGLLEE